MGDHKTQNYKNIDHLLTQIHLYFLICLFFTGRNFISKLQMSGNQYVQAYLLKEFQ